MDIELISKVRKPVHNETSSGGYSFYCSFMENGTRLIGVVAVVSSRLQSLVVEVTTVGELIIRLRIKHTLGFISGFCGCLYLSV